MRTSRHAYAEHDTGEVELCDTDADPHQLESLHANLENADLVAELSGRLKALKRCSGEACRAAEGP